MKTNIVIIGVMLLTVFACLQVEAGIFGNRLVQKSVVRGGRNAFVAPIVVAQQNLCGQRLVVRQRLAIQPLTFGTYINNGLAFGVAGHQQLVSYRSASNIQPINGEAIAQRVLQLLRAEAFISDGGGSAVERNCAECQDNRVGRGCPRFFACQCGHPDLPSRLTKADSLIIIAMNRLSKSRRHGQMIDSTAGSQR